MRSKLLSLSAVAGMVFGLTMTTAQAAPASGVGLQANPSLIQLAGWDGDRGWGYSRRWSRHGDWDRGLSWSACPRNPTANQG
jgi:hypothetical protein